MNRNQAGFSSDRLEVQSGARAVSAQEVRAWFADPLAVTHYVRAANHVGLWRSERLVFSQVLNLEEKLLDLGCGAGRIALGMWQLGFRDIVGVDTCPPMIVEAEALAANRGAGIRFEVGDATNLGFPDQTFGGAVFGFNGLMQIPGRSARRRALAEIRRVMRPGGRLVFTTHDRDLVAEASEWAKEKERWLSSTQDPRLVDFGDRLMERSEGVVFMHVPDRAEILEDLTATGWVHQFDQLRSRLANEPSVVREFSDECRFWVTEA